MLEALGSCDHLNHKKSLLLYGENRPIDRRLYFYGLADITVIILFILNDKATAFI